MVIFAYRTNEKNKLNLYYNYDKRKAIKSQEHCCDWSI